MQPGKEKPADQVDPIGSLELYGHCDKGLYPYEQFKRPFVVAGELMPRQNFLPKAAMLHLQGGDWRGD